MAQNATMDNILAIQEVANSLEYDKSLGKLTSLRSEFLISEPVLFEPILLLSLMGSQAIGLRVKRVLNKGLLLTFIFLS